MPLTASIQPYPNNDPPDFPVVQDPLSFSPDQMIGVALDGIPIYSSLDSGLVDVVTSGEVRIDRCGGMFGSTADGVRYHYRVMPTCIHSRLRRVNNSKFTLALDEDDKVKRRRSYISDMHELLQYFEEEEEEGSEGPVILGYALSGHPIFSPLETSGVLHADLDNCNGKYDNGVYGYYTRPTFPYVIGCNGPGLIRKDGLDHESLQALTGVKWNACPAGFKISMMYEGGCEPCPAGRYSPSSSKYIPGGVIEGILSCNMVCPMGFYCPPGSIRPLKCPAGRYGSSLGLENDHCSGLCAEGYFCPAGSTTPRAHVCGSQTYFCPPGSAVPRLVDDAFYTLPESPDKSKRTSQAICPSSEYCNDGLRFKCPPGVYGNTSGLTNSDCTNLCPPGFYCLEGSVNPTRCPAGRYGSSFGLNTSDCSGPCQKGYWCPAGSTTKTQVACAAGRYGPVEGLISEQCVDPTSESCELSGGPNSTTSAGTRYCVEDNICAAGYFCPEASTRPDEMPCGGPNFYCPPGSAKPHLVDQGYYTIGPKSPAGGDQSSEDAQIRYSFVPCEEGYWCRDGIKNQCSRGKYGGVRGLSDEECSGPCKPGFICDAGSWTAFQRECGLGPEVYCPSGSFQSTIAPAGTYTSGGSLTTRSTILPCPPCSYCIHGIKRLCPPGRYSQNGSSSALCDGLCEAGYYCPEGSNSKQQYPCPGGRWGSEGMGDESCSGSCEPGYYCNTSSTSSRQNECGNEFFYCPPGSPTPLSVESGYYSVGGTSNTRVGQQLCTTTLPPTLGQYCSVRNDIVCYSDYGYEMMVSLQRGYWDNMGAWVSNFWDQIDWRITRDGRFCHTKFSEDRTDTVISGSHCSSSYLLYTGDPPQAKSTHHICPDTTVP